MFIIKIYLCASSYFSLITSLLCLKIVDVEIVGVEVIRVMFDVDIFKGTTTTFDGTSIKSAGLSREDFVISGADHINSSVGVIGIDGGIGGVSISLCNADWVLNGPVPRASSVACGIGVIPN